MIKKLVQFLICVVDTQLLKGVGLEDKTCKIYNNMCLKLFTSKSSKPNMSNTPINRDWSAPGFVQELICCTSQVNVRE